MFEIPICFFIFRRPDTTKKVFNAICQIKPKRLYIISDGPRNNDEKKLCSITRNIVSKITWQCDVKELYSDSNLGVRNRIVSGLDWVFEREDRAIILEDDCLPDISFFQYCEELLNYYEDDPQIMTISGNNFMFEKNIINESYFFTKYAHIWGWATWKKAWEKFHSWDPLSTPLDLNIFNKKSEKKFWMKKYSQILKNKMNYTWDYQWALVCMANKSFSICPSVNLVSNIGFGVDGTNTKDNSVVASMPTEKMTFPLIHPTKKTWNEAADNNSAELFFHSSLFDILNRILSILKIKYDL